MDKVTAGRDAMSKFAPKFAELTMMSSLERFGRERISSRPVTVA